MHIGKSGLFLKDSGDPADPVRRVAVRAKPVLAQGVLRLRRLVLVGEAYALIRRKASSVLSASLFRPATTITFLGPKIMEATRLPVASILTRLPVRVRALVPVRKRSLVSCRRMIDSLSSREVPVPVNK